MQQPVRPLVRVTSCPMLPCLTMLWSSSASAATSCSRCTDTQARHVRLEVHFRLLDVVPCFVDDEIPGPHELTGSFVPISSVQASAWKSDGSSLMVVPDFCRNMSMARRLGSSANRCAYEDVCWQGRHLAAWTAGMPVLDNAAQTSRT